MKFNELLQSFIKDNSNNTTILKRLYNFKNNDDNLKTVSTFKILKIEIDKDKNLYLNINSKLINNKINFYYSVAINDNKNTYFINFDFSQNYKELKDLESDLINLFTNSKHATKFVVGLTYIKFNLNCLNNIKYKYNSTQSIQDKLKTLFYLSLKLDNLIYLDYLHCFLNTFEMLNKKSNFIDLKTFIKIFEVNQHNNSNNLKNYLDIILNVFNQINSNYSKHSKTFKELTKQYNKVNTNIFKLIDSKNFYDLSNYLTQLNHINTNLINVVNHLKTFNNLNNLNTYFYNFYECLDVFNFINDLDKLTNSNLYRLINLNTSTKLDKIDLKTVSNLFDKYHLNINQLNKITKVINDINELGDFLTSSNYLTTFLNDENENKQLLIHIYNNLNNLSNVINLRHFKNLFSNDYNNPFNLYLLDNTALKLINKTKDINKFNFELQKARFKNYDGLKIDSQECLKTVVNNLCCDNRELLTYLISTNFLEHFEKSRAQSIRDLVFTYNRWDNNNNWNLHHQYLKQIKQTTNHLFYKIVNKQDQPPTNNLTINNPHLKQLTELISTNFTKDLDDLKTTLLNTNQPLKPLFKIQNKIITLTQDNNNNNNTPQDIQPTLFDIQVINKSDNNTNINNNDNTNLIIIDDVDSLTVNKIE